MANNVIPINQARMPAAMKARVASGVAVNKNYSEGVADSFPRLSIKGKNFAIRIDGATEVLRDPNTKVALNVLDLVLVNGSNTLSKSYYASDFQDDGDFTPPDCWSLDSLRPDPSVADKQSPTCVGCPKNAFGSAPSRDGTTRAGKACQDARRIAVIFPGQLEQDNPLIFMLRVPQTSLKDLKKYAQLLERQDWDTAACVTRLTFDEVAYPKLRFNFVDGLTDDEYAHVVELADSKFVAAMLGAPDFDNAAVQTNEDQSSAPPPRTRQETPQVGDQAGTPAEAALPSRKRADPKPAEREVVTAKQSGTVEDVIHGDKLKLVDTVGLIELPDGRWFDPVNKAYVDRPAPKVDMPAMDEETITLPDGRFFSRRTNAFVTGPELGAKAFVAEVVPKRTRAKKPPAAPPAGEQAGQQAAPEAEQQAPEAEQQPAEQDAKAVGPAPAGLDDILKSVMPGAKASRK